MDLHGRVVVITGASSGIGRATALACARRGARLVLAARGGAELERLAALCRSRHRVPALPCPTDVTDIRSVEALAAGAVRRFGGIDVWVNAAGVGILGRFDQVSSDDLRRLLDENVVGAVHGARAALPVMTRQGHGTLIDVASLLGGVVDAPYMAAYAMSKAALTTFDTVLRQELALAGADGVDVCTVLPAGVDTPLFRHAANRTGRNLRALPPTATPERVARALTAVMDRPRPRTLVGPHARTLVLAHSVAPALTRKAIARRVERRYLDSGGTAPLVPGILHRPCAGTAAVRGGRGSGWRTALRGTGTAAACCCLAVLGARAVARRRRGV